MPADFAKAMRHVLESEGVRFDENGNPLEGKTGYVNHPSDPGGETNYGITVAVAKESNYTGPMKDIPYPQVLSIYRHRYWYPIRGETIENQAVATRVLDCAVNCGTGAAVRILQEALNSFGAMLEEDGKMGRMTMEALDYLLAKGATTATHLLTSLRGFQVAHYRDICKRKPDLKVFFPGWMYRVERGEA